MAANQPVSAIQKKEPGFSPCSHKTPDPMQQAKVGRRLITAGPDSPETAQCPACGAPVRRRKRRVHNGQPTYFYRHEPDSGEGCPLRYAPGEQRVLRCESRLLLRGLRRTGAANQDNRRRP
jgi:hypothetical protein